MTCPGRSPGTRVTVPLHLPGPKPSGITKKDSPPTVAGAALDLVPVKKRTAPNSLADRADQHSQTERAETVPPLVVKACAGVDPPIGGFCDSTYVFRYVGCYEQPPDTWWPMSDAEIPDRIGPAARWAIAGIFLFVFVLGASDSFREGKPVVGSVYAVLFIVTFLIAVKWNRIADFAKERASHLFRVLASIGILAAGIAIGTFVGRRPEFATPAAIGDIIWNFEQTTKGSGYFLNMQKVLLQPNQEIRVTGFGAHGKSNVNAPISDFKGYLRSDLTNVQIPIFIVAQDPDDAKALVCVGQPWVPTTPSETFGIPPFADFDIVTFEKPFVQPGVDGITLTKFMNDFVPFSIVLEYGGTRYERQFSKAEVERQVALFERSLTPQSNPRVMRKANAKPAPLTPLTTLLPASPPKNPPGLASPIPQTGLPKLPQN